MIICLQSNVYICSTQLSLLIFPPFTYECAFRNRPLFCSYVFSFAFFVYCSVIFHVNLHQECYSISACHIFLEFLFLFIYVIKFISTITSKAKNHLQTHFNCILVVFFSIFLLAACFFPLKFCFIHFAIEEQIPPSNNIILFLGMKGNYFRIRSHKIFFHCVRMTAKFCCSK